MTTLRLPGTRPHRLDIEGAVLDVGTSSPRRRLPIHLGLREWDGFVYPELYVRHDAGRVPRLVGRVLPVLLAPLIAPYTWVQRRHLGRRFVEYRSRDSMFWHSSGPAAYLHSAVGRLLGRSARADAGSTPKDVTVVDDFYADPYRVRDAALATPMTYYEKGWFTTAGVQPTAMGIMTEARARCAETLGVPITDAGFGSAEPVMPGWNGAYHAKLSENLLATASCAIHNHALLGSDAWACVVYLNDTGQPEHGTSVWRRRGGGGHWLEPDVCFDSRVLRFDLVATVPARFNRCVIMPAYALHRGEDGFGYDKESARLFQTFFFVAPRPAGTR